MRSEGAVFGLLWSMVTKLLILSISSWQEHTVELSMQYNTTTRRLDRRMTRMFSGTTLSKANSISCVDTVRPGSSGKFHFGGSSSRKVLLPDRGRPTNRTTGSPTGSGQQYRRSQCDKRPRQRYSTERATMPPNATA
eukprot:CAMPEP_0175886672 /NCGR_PEP_ID=MMETSP0107_2-20121207/45757_1 /TAXON_ID=195067 ORGANISM="Goniomonas pacifica, Strain CCMP1869" /NCGR_SAMPLE_ID=MMETSP0107_2 /ASSEMBLY_ACC=CAM_ASM_000203 /LENGTH=136 /DNA_ID=CAMNT_0017207061 /DNA_START=27 /DNA_END=433 /DNA_ORIENTATION=+